ncbi:rolling circle replication-associated protein [Nocardioides dongxiaopingii]|uniref:rolling circle replication-associated protein n=1 Tax=Nocardioides dongxiaopingii TaxID=2576036 RepID=UPI003CCC5818
MRRYCVSNELTRLGTLTYGPPFCVDPRRARRDVGLFFRRLRAALGGEPLPYAWVPEYHKDQQRLHLHFAAGRYIKRSLIEESWGHGFVHIKRLTDVSVGTGRRGEARVAAGYLSKYVSKAFADQRLKGAHRYDVGQGFRPEKMTVWGRSARDVLDQASDLLSQQGPVVVWHSDDQPDWQGPPAVWAQWA